MIHLIVSTFLNMLPLMICAIPFIGVGIIIRKKQEEESQEDKLFLGIIAYIFLWFFTILIFGATCYFDNFLEEFAPSRVTNPNNISFDFLSFYQDTVLVSVTGESHAVVNLFGNIALFVPIGFLYSWLYKNNVSNKELILKNTIKALFLSLTVETIQLCFVRIADVTDVLINTLGGFLGCLIFIYLMALTENFRGRYKRSNFSSGKYILIKSLNIAIYIICVIWVTNYIL